MLWADPRSANLGVRALAEGAAVLCRRAFGEDTQVQWQSHGRTGGAPMPLGSPRSLAREYVTGRRGLRQWIGDFDLVLDTRSGDSFADIYGLRRLVTMSLVAEVAHRTDVPLVMGPQTIGPFDHRRGRALARRALRHAGLVMARDPASAEQARLLGRPADILTTDVVFALGRPCAVESRDVVLNISGLLWHGAGHVDPRRYRAVLARLHDGLLARGRRVSLLAHVLDSPRADNDVPAVQEFAARHAPASEVILPRSLDEARAVLAGARLVLGSRMHACLNALSVGTPAVPLAYSRKFEPLMRDLRWPYTTDLRSSEDVVEQVLEVVDTRGLDADVRQVNEAAASRVERAVEALRSVLT